jgi:hypothetical protein
VHQNAKKSYQTKKISEYLFIKTFSSLSHKLHHRLQKIGHVWTSEFDTDWKLTKEPYVSDLSDNPKLYGLVSYRYGFDVIGILDGVHRLDYERSRANVTNNIDTFGVDGGDKMIKHAL